MAAQFTPKNGFGFRRALGEQGWNVEYDDNWRILEALLSASVISASTAAEPGSPSNGDLYIVPISATGTQWTGQDEKLAYYDGSGSGGADEWVFIDAIEGQQYRAQDENQNYQFDGTNWDYIGSQYSSHADDTAAGVAGVPIGGIYTNSGTGALHVRLT